MLKSFAAAVGIALAAPPAAAHQGHGAIPGHFHFLGEPTGTLAGAAIVVAVIGLAIYALSRLPGADSTDAE
jgi:hypothetical protein